MSQSPAPDPSPAPRRASVRGRLALAALCLASAAFAAWAVQSLAQHRPVMVVMGHAMFAAGLGLMALVQARHARGG